MLPIILLPNDPRPVAEQLDDRYAHGGGYRPSGDKFTLIGHPAGDMALQYPGDPDFPEVSRCQINSQLCVLFSSSFMAIIEQDNSHVIVRVD